MFWRLAMLLFLVLMIASLVAAAYYHVGRYAERYFGAAVLIFLVIVGLGVLLKDRIDFDA